MTFMEIAQSFGSFGEFFGAIAVVATLAYLAKQIRNQNDANQIAAFESVIDGFNEMVGMMAADKAVARTFIVGLNEPDQLDDDEAGCFSCLFRMYMNSYNKMYGVYQRGAMTEQQWSAFAAEAALLLESPGGRAWLNDQSYERFEYVRAIREHFDPDTRVDLNLGRSPLRRA